MAAALVDVDGTLLRGASSEYRFFRHLLASGRLGRQQRHQWVRFCIRWWPVYSRQVLRKNKAYLTGLAVADVEVCAKRWVETRLLRSLRPSMLHRLEMHRRAGEPFALLTGTPDFIARPLAGCIGAVAYGATRCATAERHFSAAPPLAHPFGLAKLEQAHGLCTRLGWTLADCTAYADSLHDLALLRSVGRAVAVHPSRRLAAVARQEGWEVVPR